MLKIPTKVFIGTLTAGLLLGGAALFNVPTANAACSQGSYQQMAGYQSNMTLQSDEPARQQSSYSYQETNYQQFNNQQSGYSHQQFDKQLTDRKQLPDRKNMRGGQMHRFMGVNIISQVADILEVDEETIIESLRDGQTLVEIAEDYDISEDELLEQLEDLQSEAIDDAVESGVLTDDQADRLKDQLAGRLEQIVERTNIMPNINSESEDTSKSDIEDTLNDYFEDAGDDYFADDGIDVTISLSGDEDDLAYTIKLDFDDADDYDNLTDVSETDIKSFLNDVESKIENEIDDTGYEDADITGKLMDNDQHSNYVKYDGSSYTFSWD